MANDVQCEYCGCSFPQHCNSCPHCARPGLFPNVRAAQASEEAADLDRRYQTALKSACDRGCELVIRDFEQAVQGARAVIARSFHEVFRIATSDNEMCATYYQLVRAQVKLPTGDKWDALRRAADSIVLPGYAEHIHFGALSLDANGLTNYGDCFLVLREDMTAHRASVFESNSTLFVERRGIQGGAVPSGYRAPWDAKSKLCVAKLADGLQPDTLPTQYAGLVLQNGPTSADDEFVEVHVFGPITRRTLHSVKVCMPRSRAERAMQPALREKLEEAGVDLEAA